jgi:hypothetical protein
VELLAALGVRHSPMKPLIYSILAAVISGCAREPAAQQLFPPLATTQPVSKQEGNVDQEVIDVVLHDLLTTAETPLANRDGPPDDIRIDVRVSKYKPKAQQVMMRHDKALWAALSESQVKAATEAADALVRRHEAGEGLMNLKRRDPRVTLESADPAPPKTPEGIALPPMGDDRAVHGYAPGFSADGQVAVVFLSLPWSMHHADATYILVRDADTFGGWRVVLRQFVYYV